MIGMCVMRSTCFMLWMFLHHPDTKELMLLHQSCHPFLIDFDS